MPNDLRSTLRAAPPSSALDDALASLQVEDFTELPPPAPFSTGGRLHDKRHARACRPVLQRQKAVLCIEDLDAEDGPVPVRASSRGYMYRRAASADYPRSFTPPVLGLQRGCHDTNSATTASTSTPEVVRLMRPRRGLHWPY